LVPSCSPLDNFLTGITTSQIPELCMVDLSTQEGPEKLLPDAAAWFKTG
jgi:hypothetical protein